MNNLHGWISKFSLGVGNLCFFLLVGINLGRFLRDLILSRRRCWLLIQELVFKNFFVFRSLGNVLIMSNREIAGHDDVLDTGSLVRCLGVNVEF